MHEHIEVIARTARVLADKTGFVGLVYSELHIGRLVVELATYVDVGSSCAHRTAGDQTTFDELVRVMSHDLAVLARARLTFVGVNHQVFRSTVARLVHEAPLQA